MKNKIGIQESCRLFRTRDLFTAKILHNLAKRKILNAQKESSGGFRIARDLEKISLFDIVEAIDGQEKFIGCGK